jgi:hypothetical protein
VALHFTVSNEAHYREDGALHFLRADARLDEFRRFARKKGFPLFFEPPSLIDRIVNQAAILSVAPASRRLKRACFPLSLRPAGAASSRRQVFHFFRAFLLASVGFLFV